MSILAEKYQQRQAFASALIDNVLNKSSCVLCLIPDYCPIFNLNAKDFDAVPCDPQRGICSSQQFQSRDVFKCKESMIYLLFCYVFSSP